MIPRKTFLFSAFGTALLTAARRWPRLNRNTVLYLTSFDQAIQWLSDSGVALTDAHIVSLRWYFDKWEGIAIPESEFAAVFLTALADCFNQTH